MIDFFSQHYVEILLWLATITLLAFWVWWRTRQTVSKASFAFLVITTISACFTAFLKTFDKPLASKIYNNALPTLRKLRGLDVIPDVDPEGNNFIYFLLLSALALTIFFIYRFSVTAITHWDAPPTILVNELAKSGLDNNLFSLAKAEFIRFLQQKSDPIADKNSTNWRQEIAEPPAAPRWEQSRENCFCLPFLKRTFQKTGGGIEREHGLAIYIPEHTILLLPRLLCWSSILFQLTRS